MSGSDAAIPLSLVDGTLVLSDGSTNTHTVAFLETEWSWTNEGQPYAEARTRNKHHSTPTARITGDGNVTGNFKALCLGLKGSAAATTYEVLEQTDTASGWVTTGAGDKKMIRATLTGNASAAGGANQTYAFNYCIFSNVKITPGGSNGLWTIEADFVDHENRPTVT